MVADGLTNGEHVYSEGEGTKDGTLRITAHNSIFQITVVGWELDLLPGCWKYETEKYFSIKFLSIFKETIFPLSVQLFIMRYLLVSQIQRSYARLLSYISAQMPAIIIN